MHAWLPPFYSHPTVGFQEFLLDAGTLQAIFPAQRPSSNPTITQNNRNLFTFLFEMHILCTPIFLYLQCNNLCTPQICALKPIHNMSYYVIPPKKGLIAIQFKSGKMCTHNVRAESSCITE